MASQRNGFQAQQQEPTTKKKKIRKGISVGPGNLPDGTHRRKGIYFVFYIVIPNESFHHTKKKDQINFFLRRSELPSN